MAASVGSQVLDAIPGPSPSSEFTRDCRGSILRLHRCARRESPAWSSCRRAVPRDHRADISNYSHPAVAPLLCEPIPADLLTPPIQTPEPSPQACHPDLTTPTCGESGLDA